MHTSAVPLLAVRAARAARRSLRTARALRGSLRSIALATILAVTASACTVATDQGPQLVADVVIAPKATSVVAGSTRQFLAQPRDVQGRLLTGRVVTWAVTGSGTASIDEQGLLTAIAPGTVTVTARSEGQSISAAVNVLPVPVASIRLTPSAMTLAAGATAQALATPLDAAGNALTARLVTWSSDAPAIAAVDGAGLLTAVSPGSVQVVATSEGVRATATITVTPGSVGPIITSITPATLQPGTTITVSAAGLSKSNIGNVLTIGGVVAPIVTATNTELTASVPCLPNGTVTVSLTTNGVAGPPLTRLLLVPRRTLAIGDATIGTSLAASACTELATSGATARYLVTVFSASTSPNSAEDFELTGNVPAAGMSALRVAVPQPARARAFALDDRQAAQDAKHFAFLERERAQYVSLRARAQALSQRQRSSGAAGAPSFSRAAAQAPIPTLGAKRSSYFTFAAGCTDTTQVVRSRAIYIGSRAIIWEDTANVLQSTSTPALADYYQRLGQIFDQEQYASVKDNFGDPLLRDAATDNDGRIHMLFSQRLNGTGAGAYVTSCDQFSPLVAPGSNFGQYFYGAVPVTAALNLNSLDSPDGWFYFMARTVVHEVKHIAAMSARVANNAPTFEQTWLEEGTARHAEELWVRESLHHVAWKGGTGFGSATSVGVFCDFNPADATCNAADALHRPSYGMRRHFDEIREKLVAPWDYSPYGDAVVQGNGTFYQTAWSLVRYTIDRYAASDASFFHTLLNAQTSGTVNLAATAGVSMDQLIGGWGLALFADHYPGLTSPSPDIQFPTWNLRSIYAGLNALPAWSLRWSTPFPIQPAQLAFGSFVAPVYGLRGGAHAYFEISGGTNGTQLIGLRSTQGVPVPANLRIAIARLQ